MEQEKNNKAIKELILISIMPMIIAMIIEIFFKLSNDGIGDLFNIKSVNALIFSISIIYILYAIILGITKKNSTTIKIICVVSCIFLVVNQVKILYTGEPLVISDLNFLVQFGEIATLTYSTMVSKILPSLLGVALLILIFFVIIKWVKKHEKIVENTKIRILMTTIGIIILLILFIPNKYTRDIYLNIVFHADKHTDYNSYTTNLTYYKQYTLLSGIWGVMLNNIFTEPDNYNEEEIDNLLEEANKNNVEKPNTWGKPNIILIFSEAFWNIDKLEEVQLSSNFAESIDEMEEKGKKVELLSCSYGGMSENVSFELLTGTSMNYFPNGYIPIMSLYKRKNIIQAPSIIKELNKNDYYSKIVFGRDYYNSEDAFKKLGFNEYEELEETDNNKKGYFISDKYMMEEIIKELENKPSDKKIFYMAETIQNHMPYTIDKYKEHDIGIEKNEYDEDINNTLLTYAQGAYDAIEQANKLCKYLKNYKEPTILIFLGDHLPYLYTGEGKDVIEKLQYFNTSNELENTYRRYNTEAFIMSNYDIDYKDFPQYLSDDLLITYIINQMDIEINDYYKWLYTTIDELPATNKFLFLDAQGNKYPISEIEGRKKEIYEMKENLLYKFFIKNTK